jgi:hypothetical protein
MNKALCNHNIDAEDECTLVFLDEDIAWCEQCDGVFTCPWEEPSPVLRWAPGVLARMRRELAELFPPPSPEPVPWLDWPRTTDDARDALIERQKNAWRPLPPWEERS